MVVVGRTLHWGKIIIFYIIYWKMNRPKETTMSENAIFKGKLSSLDSSSAVYENTFLVRLKGAWFGHIYKSKVILLWWITLIKRFYRTYLPESLNKINFQSLHHKLTKFFFCFYIVYGWLSRLFIATNLKTTLAPSSVKHFLLSFGADFKVFL